MKFKSFLTNYQNFPKPGNNVIAESKLAQFIELSEKDDKDLKDFTSAFSKDKGGKALLQCIFGNSPYLTQAIFKEINFFQLFCMKGLEAGFIEIKNDLDKINISSLPKEKLAKEIRRLKLRCSLLVAIADITGEWDLEKVTGSLSEFAENILKVCVNFLLLDASKKQKLEVAHPDNPSKESGLIILAVGKLGSRELNYSSDIDIIVFYDDNNTKLNIRSSKSHFFINFTQDLSNLLQNRTEDGYVFRTDLRLRPDPGSTPLAISVSAAEHYYETVGQNWERAAMIKARPIAGDIEAGEKFMEFLRRYVWRKYLDFASIQDIHSIKRQIDSKIGELPENMLGYNIKLGHGGIREIEFYVQTQQLIWGGKQSSLQVSSTCETLAALEQCGRITKQAQREMEEAYKFYRFIEHRLQMVNDQQTHSLPETKEKLEEIAIFMNFHNAAEFVEALKKSIYTVKGYYSRLFEHSPSLTSGTPGIDGSLVFTGIENDPATIKTLERMGFTEPERISEIIRGWHHGRRRSTRTKRVREILTEFMPYLLKAFSSTSNPTIAFTKFDEFLARLPAGVQLFSLCYANPEMMNLIAEIMGGYPYIADNLSRKPALLDYVLSIEFFDHIPDKEHLDSDLKTQLKSAKDLEDILNLTRSWAHDRQFRIGIHFIKNKINYIEASRHLSDIADAVLINLYEYIEGYFNKQHGKAEEYDFGVIAMGKLGSYELTFGADIDLVFVYDENGKKDTKSKSNLSPSEYFTRLSRRYIGAISSPTEQGKLYDVDTRLRPSGKDGPMVSYLGAYRKYYNELAWSWEMMALTRARVLLAPQPLNDKIRNIITEQLTKKRDKKKLSEEILDMRERVARTHGSQNIFDIKYAPGGLMDLEYVIQFLQLLHANKHPDIIKGNIIDSVKQLGKDNILKKGDESILLEAVSLFYNMQSILRLMDNEKPKEEIMTMGMKKILYESAGHRNFIELKKNLEKSQKNVQKLMKQYISYQA